MMANKRRKFDPNFRLRKRQKNEQDEEGEDIVEKRIPNAPGSGGRIPKKHYAILFGYAGTGKGFRLSHLLYLFIRISWHAKVS